MKRVIVFSLGVLTVLAVIYVGDRNCRDEMERLKPLDASSVIGGLPCYYEDPVLCQYFPANCDSNECFFLDPDYLCYLYNQWQLQEPYTPTYYSHCVDGAEKVSGRRQCKLRQINCWTEIKCKPFCVITEGGVHCDTENGLDFRYGGIVWEQYKDPASAACGPGT